MAKIYQEQNVYEAALERIAFIFDHFENIYFSVSGGKDSSVMLQLAAQVATNKNKKFDVLYIDLEAQYAATITHIKELKKITSSVVRNWYWVALPLSLRNAVSILQPKWTCWDRAQQNKWVRELPIEENIIHEENHLFDFFYHDMEFEQFIQGFAKWYTQQHTGLCACGIGIRADESLNRYGTIISTKKERFQNCGWTTQVKISSKKIPAYNFYPIYDWHVNDIWIAVFKNNFIFNAIYELMQKNGLSLHEQRLCQPYGDDQRNGLNQFKALEFDTWEKVLHRVHGVNFGNIYCRTSLLGNITSEKPPHLSWEEYAVFLLQTIGLYSPELEQHYRKKILVFMNFYEKNEGISVEHIPDEQQTSLESQKKVISWRRIARALEKNDFWLSRLSFAATKKDVEQLKSLKKRFSGVFFGESNNKALNKLKEELQ